jgi:rhodanese-related sulfurtransferase
MIKNKYASLLAAVLVSLLFSNFLLTAGPELSFSEGQKVKLGNTTEGQLKIGAFTIKNVGDEELKIKNYIITCSCLKLIERKTPTLAPGESINLKFVFDTSDLAGKKARKSIIVFSSSEDGPHRLYVTTEVSGQKSYQVNFHEMTEGFDVLVDLRPPEAYNESHIIGAINVPATDFSDWLQTVPGGVILHVYSENGRKSDEIVKDLQQSCKPELRSLIGGFVQWKLRHETYIEK